uniref:ATP synthase F0 subunit 8 n=1 Tax=Trichuris ovis TaxID=93034 RepID=J3S808_9BILA|nr:ATP synthase F0 subunit 8 [Trichuris ovis]AFK81056.1 ATP synthase F0 subunit 8 [Trichuris ovis]
MSIQSINSLMLLLFQIGPLSYHTLPFVLSTILLYFILSSPFKSYSFQKMIQQGLKS